MTIVQNWKAVATRAWSVRFLLLSAGVEFGQQTVPLFQDLLPWWVPLALALGALVSRFVQQDAVSGGAE